VSKIFNKTNILFYTLFRYKTHFS